MAALVLANTALITRVYLCGGNLCQTAMPEHSLTVYVNALRSARSALFGDRGTALAGGRFEASEPITDAVSTAPTSSMTEDFFSPPMFRSEQPCLNQAVPALNADLEKESTPTAHYLPDIAVKTDESSLAVFKSFLEVFDSNLELMSTAVANTPLPFLWNTLQQCPSSSIQSFEAGLCVSAKLFRDRNVLSALKPSEGALDWLKHEISAHMITCTGQSADKDSSTTKVLISIPSLRTE